MMLLRASSSAQDRGGSITGHHVERYCEGEHMLQAEEVVWQKARRPERGASLGRKDWTVVTDGAQQCKHNVHAKVVSSPIRA
eukprot:9090568-Karenia_brevis.AAC.1